MLVIEVPTDESVFAAINWRTRAVNSGVHEKLVLTLQPVLSHVGVNLRKGSKNSKAQNT